VRLNKIAGRVKATTMIAPNSVSVSQRWVPRGWFSRRVRRVSTAVAGTGLGVAARFELIATVDNYVAGNVLHAVESLARARAAEADPAMVAAAA